VLHDNFQQLRIGFDFIKKSRLMAISISSENLSINPQALDNEVPPLNVMLPFNSGI